MNTHISSCNPKSGAIFTQSLNGTLSNILGYENPSENEASIDPTKKEINMNMDLAVSNPDMQVNKGNSLLDH